VFDSGTYVARRVFFNTHDVKTKGLQSPKRQPAFESYVHTGQMDVVQRISNTSDWHNNPAFKYL